MLNSLATSVPLSWSFYQSTPPHSTHANQLMPSLQGGEVERDQQCGLSRDTASSVTLRQHRTESKQATPAPTHLDLAPVLAAPDVLIVDSHRVAFDGPSRIEARHNTEVFRVRRTSL